MKRVLGVVTGIAVLLTQFVHGGVAAETPAVVAQGPAWGACPQEQGKPVAANVECASVRVPLDHRDPWGHSITIALNRIKAKVARDANHLGTLLVNPGGPGASGRQLAEFVSMALPNKLGERYDVIGFDPRGVGASRPSVRCVDPDVYYKAPRPDAVPHSRAEEQALLDRAKEYANRCGDMWAWLLPHLTTENSARDLDRIRAALGEEKISYLGYSYGTYLGAVYATLFPDRVKRLVLDSVVDPTGVWYRSNLTQDPAFEGRHRAFLTWVARHHSAYKLGNTTRQASFAFYAMRDRLRGKPAAGVIGPSELDDTFTIAGYSDRTWPELAQAWSDYVRKGATKGLQDAYAKHGKNDAEDENGYAIYLGVQCRDARWPRDWAVWRADMTRMHRHAPFLTWPNAWFNAPCAFWSVPGGTPVRVTASPKLPPILMIQSVGDAATPYEGSLVMRRRFPSARMVVDRGGNHGVSLGGNRCIDGHLAAYLADGTLPAQDTSCRAMPAPEPAPKPATAQKAHMSARAGSPLPVGPLGHDRLTEVIAR
ncbi:alpha/beta fold hydrolase [Nonomuraea sp. NN258]|uniref:alpha/beta hydrolase n=1 Tax=Nonomuraea antri TaxID=2730852 RepID=UPI001569DF7C|nr:alpha/beta hydrolase [Nonomuraea antri]NRQ37963.1 alpha/beta fold hydrolase [Nonomuraea antri]